MQTKSDRTRSFIIEKAAHLFNKKGFHGTSMSDILESTGLAKGGVYGHFKSKEEIVGEAFEYSFQKIRQELADRIKSKNNAVDKLTVIVDYYYNYTLLSPIEGGCPILNYTSHADESLPQLKKLVTKAAKTMLESLVHIIENGKKHKQLRPDIPSKLTAGILYSRIEGAIMLGKATNDVSRLNELLDDIKRYIHSELKK